MVGVQGLGFDRAGVVLVCACELGLRVIIQGAGFVDYDVRRGFGL